MIEKFINFYKEDNLFYIMNLLTEDSLPVVSAKPQTPTQIICEGVSSSKLNELSQQVLDDYNRFKQEKEKVTEISDVELLKIFDMQIKHVIMTLEKATLDAEKILLNFKKSLFTDSGFSIDGTSGQVNIDKKHTLYSIDFINIYPGFIDLLKELFKTFDSITTSIVNLKNKVIEIKTDPKSITDENVKSVTTSIDEIIKQKKLLANGMQKFNNVLLLYKNAFVTLSFQIASTLFGYGVSILQIFMQNFPEKLNSFTPLAAGSTEEPNYGLQQLNALKAPFQPFVTAKDIENQEFYLSDYAPVFTSSPGTTPFNLLLPIADLSSMPLFTKDKIQPASASGGGKKQRRLLPPRPKKRKTIKYKFNTTKKTNKPKKTKKTIKKGNKKRKTSIRKK